MKAIIFLFIFVIFVVGCTADDTQAKENVLPASISDFFKAVESQNFHSISRIGEQIFRPGLYIPDHDNIFYEIPNSEYGEECIRYVLYSFQGEESAGEVYLILEKNSGKIVEYNHYEVIYK
jgi:hypothetical protein